MCFLLNIHKTLYFTQGSRDADGPVDHAKVHEDAQVCTYSFTCLHITSTPEHLYAQGLEILFYF